MAIEFTTWRAELTKVKNAIAKNESLDYVFQGSHENKQQMRVTYRRLPDLTAFIDWLEMKAMEEESSISSGSFLFTVGGD